MSVNDSGALGGAGGGGVSKLKVEYELLEPFVADHDLKAAEAKKRTKKAGGGIELDVAVGILGEAQIDRLASEDLGREVGGNAQRWGHQDDRLARGAEAARHIAQLARHRPPKAMPRQNRRLPCQNRRLSRQNRRPPHRRSF